jgi:hypothetical protein
VPGYPSAILVFALTHSRRNVVPTLVVDYLLKLDDQSAKQLWLK